MDQWQAGDNEPLSFIKGWKFLYKQSFFRTLCMETVMERILHIMPPRKYEEYGHAL
jgi:hypothetical protein